VVIIGIKLFNSQSEGAHTGVSLCPPQISLDFTCDLTGLYGEDSNV
jgi:hypothetical protein